MGRKSRLKKLKEQQFSNSSNLVYIAYTAVVTAIFSLAFTILKEGFPSGHDIAAHIVRSKVFKEALYQGQFPVRWIEWTWAGTSHPMFNFYQGGFYYLVVFLDFIIHSHIESIKIMVLGFWWLGALFMFLFIRRFGNLAGTLSALVFAFTPYIIADVFVRAAYPEFGAIAFSLGLFWSLDRILRTAKPLFAVPMSLCIMGIITFHLPTLVIMTPIALAYTGLLLINKEIMLRGIAYAFSSLILGVGLASFYIFPAIFELKYIKSELLTSGYYDFHPHFVYFHQLFDTKWGYGISKEGPNDGMSFQFGLLQWGIILLSLCVFTLLLYRKKLSKVAAAIGFWLFSILYALFFMHDTSLSFWENWEFIAFIQYPWRFLMIVAIAAAALAGILISLLRNNWHKIFAVFTVLILIILLYRGMLAPSTFVRKEDFDIDAADWRKRESIVVNSFVEQGYLPREVEVMPRRDIAKWEVVGSLKTPPQSDPKKDPRVEERVIKDHHFLLVTTSQEPLILRLNIHYFPGWKVFIDGREAQVEHSNIYGFMNVVVPSGIHSVEAKFTDTLVRTVSNAITVLSLVALAVWQGLGVRGRR